MIVPKSNSANTSNVLTTVVYPTAALVATTAIATKVDSVMRQSDAVFDHPTTAKMQRTGCYAIASLFPIVTAKMTNDPLATVVSLVGSAVTVFLATQIRDYQDPRECAVMRREAQDLSFDQLEKKHGLHNLPALQIPNLAQKFMESCAAKAFSQIVLEYPLDTIFRYELAEPVFLRAKFVEEVRDHKLNFIKNWVPSELFLEIISNRMYTGLISIQTRYSKLPSLDGILKEIGEKYPARTEIINAQFAKREANIPVLARDLAKKDVNLQSQIRALDLELIDTLNGLAIRYSDRADEQEKKFQLRQAEILEEAKKVGQDVKNGMLHGANREPDREPVGVRNSMPQTVNATIAAASGRVPVGARSSNPLNSNVRVTLEMAESAGKLAEQNYAKSSLDKLRNEYLGKSALGVLQQRSYDLAVLEARQLHKAKCNSVKVEISRLTQEHTTRLMDELLRDRQNANPEWERQQQNYNHDVEEARRKRQEELLKLETEIVTVLSY